MEVNLVSEFMSKTGRNAIEAHNFLQARGWDLQQAIADCLLETNSDAFCGGKKLARGISRATDNLILVSKARHELGLESLKEDGVCSKNKYFMESPIYTFTLPDLTIFPDDFREFLEKDLIEMSSLVSLEQAGRLNWWTEENLCQKLWPLSTTGDGNCLLHAASLGIWGFHDRLLTLRRALHDFLSESDCRQALWRRWRWQMQRLNKEAGLILTEDEWIREWEAIVSMASSTPRNMTERRRSMVMDKPNKDITENATYESLEEIHVLVLAHVLKRPIIVIADTMLKDVHGENLAPIFFGGIYLPLEISPEKCHKTPLILTYDAAHFSALVLMDTVADKTAQPPAVIPLTDKDHQLLPVQFVIDPGDDYNWDAESDVHRPRPTNRDYIELLKNYLNVVQIPLTTSPSSDDYDVEMELETPGDEEDIEKRFIEAANFSDENNGANETTMFGGNRSKAARQIQNVAKQFGSIGKSMSKKLKKNLGTITKLTRSNSVKKLSKDAKERPDYLVCAKLDIGCKHDYQEEMVKNYLETARARFENEQRNKKTSTSSSSSEDERLRHQAKLEGPKNCITPGCVNFGTALTAYLCKSCYDKQRQQELSTTINSPILSRHEPPIHYGTGKSKFYVDSSASNNTTISSSDLPTGNSCDNVILRNKISTSSDDLTPLQLSRSTFYPERLYLRDWQCSSAGRNPHTELNSRRKTLQETKTAVDADLNSFEPNNPQIRRIHSYNLNNDLQFQPNTKMVSPGLSGSSSAASHQNVKQSHNGNYISHGREKLMSSSSNSSQELPDIENVGPRVSLSADSTNSKKTRIIPIEVEARYAGSNRQECLNVTCEFFGSPELENYCSKCYRGRKTAFGSTIV